MKQVRNTRLFVRLIIVTTLAGLLALLVGCSGLLNFGDTSENNRNSEPSEREVSMQAKEVLDGLMQDIVGPVLQLYGYDVETVDARSDAKQSWNAVFDSYQAPGEDFEADGTIEIDLLSSNPVEIRAHTEEPITFTDGDIRSVGLEEVTARWASGTTFEGNEPEEVTGRFTVDGTDYTADEVIEAMEEDDPSEEMETAGGVMHVVGIVLQFYYIGPENGMTVSTSGTGTSWQAELSFDDFAPSGDSETANGSLRAKVSRVQPFTVRATTPQEVKLRDSSGTTTISLDATVEWAEDTDPMSSPPADITGTITINGESHNIEEMGRLPDIFRTASGTYEQSFKDRAWRPLTEDPAEPWSWFDYMRFDIAPDGQQHVHRHHTGQYPPDGEINFTGPLYWHKPASGLPTLWFGSDGDDQLEFFVREYTATQLILEPEGGWGDVGPVEFLFTAGRDNLSGLLVNEEVVRTEGEWYKYREPIADEPIDLYIFDRSNDRTEFVASTTTDASGVFVWTKLSELSSDIYDDDFELFIVMEDERPTEVLDRVEHDVRGGSGIPGAFRLAHGASKHYFVGITPGDPGLDMPPEEER